MPSLQSDARQYRNARQNFLANSGGVVRAAGEVAQRHQPPRLTGAGSACKFSGLTSLTGRRTASNFTVRGYI